MEKFDVIVIGSGSGLLISSAASAMGLKVAVIEKGPMGGTCLNRGCIPSKIIIHSADVVETIKRAGLFGIHPKGYSIDFRKVISRATDLVDKEAAEIEEGVGSDENTTLFKAEARFTGPKTLKVGPNTIMGEKIFIVAGTRPAIPPVQGLDKIDYITSDEALRLQKLPATMTIIGGGYIAAELAHFYSSMGTKITIVQRNRLLVPDEDEEIARKFTEINSRRFTVYLEHQAVKVEKKAGKFVLTIEKKTGGGSKALTSDQLLVATGRVPNTDILDVAKAGVRTDKEGFIETNEYMETNVKEVWALGDIAGKFLFKHSANHEARYAFHNAFNTKNRKPVDYHAMPHAVFGYPQVAGVGLREQDLQGKDYAVGRYEYIRTGMGEAIQDTEGFAKVLADRKTRKILGCHIIGEHASSIIHEAIVAMKAGSGTTENIEKAVHIHPALSEVIQRAVLNIEW